MTLNDLLVELVPGLVPGLARKFPTLNREDIEQQCWVGILARRDSLNALVEEGELDKLRLDVKDLATKAVLSLRREQDRHNRAVRALRDGYLPEDQRFYSTGLLRVLLPAYLDNGITADPPRGRDVSPGHSGDPAETGTWLVMMLDIDQAFWAIRRHHRNVLARYFTYPQGAGGFTHDEIAGRMGVPPEQLKDRVIRALLAMQRELGGANPYPVSGDTVSGDKPGAVSSGLTLTEGTEDV